MLRSIWNIILRNIKTFTMIFALGFIWLLFSILTQFGFVQPENLSNLFRQMTIISFLSIGMVLGRRSAATGSHHDGLRRVSRQ